MPGRKLCVSIETTSLQDRTSSRWSTGLIPLTEQHLLQHSPPGGRVPAGVAGSEAEVFWS